MVAAGFAHTSPLAPLVSTCPSPVGPGSQASRSPSNQSRSPRAPPGGRLRQLAGMGAAESFFFAMKTFLLFAVAIVVVVAGCPATDTPPATVRAADLARFYRDDWPTARAAYDGQAVRLALTNPVACGGELRWHLASPDSPAVVVCRFAGPVPAVAPVVWIVGVCKGRTDDGAAREFSGYTFHVLVTDCRPAGPPGR